MRNYLAELPDEVYRQVAKYMYADPMESILKDISLVVGIWPPKDLVFMLQNGSDHIRSESLNNNFRRKIRHYRENDWYKLLIDLERPSAYKLQGEGFHTWLNMKVWDLGADGGVWWCNTKQPLRLTYAGWCRLTGADRMPWE